MILLIRAAPGIVHARIIKRKILREELKAQEKQKRQALAARQKVLQAERTINRGAYCQTVRATQAQQEILAAQQRGS